MDPFGALSDTTQKTLATVRGDMDSEFEATTMSCEETGCTPPW